MLSLSGRGAYLKVTKILTGPESFGKEKLLILKGYSQCRARPFGNGRYHAIVLCSVLRNYRVSSSRIRNGRIYLLNLFKEGNLK